MKEHQQDHQIESENQNPNPSRGFLSVPIKLVGRLLNRSQRQFRLSRPGSVLILCIALLVLLALIGTAMISTASVDRYTSAQHTYNTQIDLLVDGVKAMAQSWIQGGQYQSNTTTIPVTLFRPADQDVDQTGVSNYRKYDAITSGTCSSIVTSGAQDMWLAPRVPELAIAGPIGAANPPVWQTLTMPLAPQLNGGSSTYEFESPYRSSATVGAITASRDLGQGTFITTTSGTIFPALNMGGAGVYMAADTDGDGIADALYFKLPIGTVGGVTYYAACRIIDNNSAVNANTAWSRDYDFTNNANGFRRDTGQGILGAGILNYGFFRSNVGLMEMFPDYVGGTNPTTPGTSAQMNTGPQSINGYRFHGLNAAADPTPTVWYRDSTGAYQNRADFGYLTQGDGLEFGLASRLENPGVNYFFPDKGVVNATGTATFQAFSWSDTASLASRFAILNPSATAGELETDGSIGLMEVLPSAGTFSAITSSPYQANNTDATHTKDIFGWYNQNFDYDSISEAISPFHPIQYVRMPLRPIVVTRNPVSNLAPVPHGPYDYNGDNVGTYTIPSSIPAQGGNDPLIPPNLQITNPAGGAGDWTSNGIISTGRVGMASYTLGTGGVAINAKTNINSAPFAELWRAFWSVMAEPRNTTYAYRVGATPPLYSAPDGGIFRSTSRDPRPAAPVTGTDPGLAVQFKPSTSQMMQIRSALAAVNAIDLRDGDDDVTSREIPVYTMTGIASPGAPLLRFRVRVYGNERQPFITKIYFNGLTRPLRAVDLPNTLPPYTKNSNLQPGAQNTKGYVAVELYNPYPVPMQLNRWAIGVITRQYNTTTVPAANSYLQAGYDPGLHIRRLTQHVPAMSTMAANFDEHYLNQIDRVTGIVNNGPANTPQVVIPANGYAVLENYPPTTIGGTPFIKDPGKDAQFRPLRVSALDSAGDGNLASVAYVYVPNLSDVIQDAAAVPSGGELVLLRPHRADGTLTATIDSTGKLLDPTDANNEYHEMFFTAPGVPNLADFVPIDSFDFTGLVQSPPADNGLFTSWYYARPNDLTSNAPNAWKFVYPGLYDVGTTKNPKGTSLLTPRQEGTLPPASSDGQFANLPAEGSSPLVALGVSTPGSGYFNPFPGIQLQNQDWGLKSTYIRWPAVNQAASRIAPIGFPAVPAAPPYEYPFGGFARNGDMLMVPFIGAYQVLATTFDDNKYPNDPTSLAGTLQTPNPYAFYEFTPITMDCSFADDCQRDNAVGPTGAPDSTFGPQRSSFSVRKMAPDPAIDAAGSGDDADEQLGRFCPIQEATSTNVHVEDLTTSTGIPVNYQTGVTVNGSNVVWRYHFATRLFDYLTVQGPSDDYLPMVDPNAKDITNLTASLPPNQINAYPSGNVNPTQNSLNPPQAADHRIVAQTGIENKLPVDGLININTAPWYVLAQLPLLPPSSAGAPGANGIPANIEALAKAIVTYRETGANGSPRPFASLFDLNAYLASPAFNQATVATGGADWDTSPNGTQVLTDFEKKYLIMTRISNLITTRSDSFTVFIVVDGFRGAGTADPQLVVHRRAAMIVDRSGMTPENGTAPNQMTVSTQ